MEYLGFWVTRIGIRPIGKKEFMVKMTPPKNMRDLSAFVGLLKSYRDIWYRRSHLLHPLTALTSTKVKFKWTDVEQKAFDNIKRTVSHNTLPSYQGFN